MRIFGLEFRRAPKDTTASIVAGDHNTGGIVNELDDRYSTAGAEFVVLGQNFESAFRSNISKINFYRQMEQNPFVGEAIEDIVNECVSFDEEGTIIKIDLEKTEFSDEIKNRISEEFHEVLRLLEFDTKAHDVFRRWYVDGQFYIHLIVNKDNLDAGIQELRPVDPRRIKKVIDIRKNERGAETGRDEYFLYMPEHLGSINQWNKQGRDINATEAVKLTNDSVVYIWSGIVDLNGMPISHLDKAIKSFNQITSLEDAIIVYRLSRAPEKLAFYVDVDNMPYTASEQYMRGLIEKYKNKTTYNIQTGEVDNASNLQSMFYNYWLPRRNGKSTEIATVGNIGQTFANAEELDYFLKKLYRSMQIPLTRMSPENTTPFSRGSEITRDELKFQKLINRYRGRFNELFNTILKRQLILKGILTEEDWDDNVYHVRYDYSTDSMVYEMKTVDLMAMRMEILGQIQPYVGKEGYYSKEWVEAHILQLTNEDVERIRKENSTAQPAVATGDSAASFLGGGDATDTTDLDADPEPTDTSTDPDVRQDDSPVETDSDGGLLVDRSEKNTTLQEHLRGRKRVTKRKKK